MHRRHSRHSVIPARAGTLRGTHVMRSTTLSLCVVAIAALTGCGGPHTVPIEGVVTLDDQPIPEGYISFLPLRGGRGGGAPIVQGGYSLRAEPGVNRVQITASKMAPLPKGVRGDYGQTEAMQQYVPIRYNAETTLEANVTAPETVNFSLKSN